MNISNVRVVLKTQPGQVMGPCAWLIARVALSSVGLVAFASCADYVVFDCDATKDQAVFRALADNLAHGAIAGWCWMNVLLGQLANTNLWIATTQVGMGVVLGSLLDLDHFIAARSLRLRLALSLQHRPFAHNTLLVLGATAAIYLTLWCVPFLCTTFTCDLHLIFLLATLSHHVRDANRKGLWLGPVSTPPIPKKMYITITLLLPIILLLPGVHPLLRLTLPSAVIPNG